MTYTEPVWFSIRDALRYLMPDRHVNLEGGGAAATVIEVANQDGSSWLIGDANGDIAGDFYPDEESRCDWQPSESVQFQPTTEGEPVNIAIAILGGIRRFEIERAR